MFRVLSIAIFLSTTLAAQGLPTGFVDELLVSGLNRPVAFAMTTDGRFFVTEKLSGQIVACNASGATQVCGTVPGLTFRGERGLLGIAVDPGWPAAPYVYVTYTHVSGTARLSRFTLTGDVNVPNSTSLALGDRYDILTTIPDASFHHNAGALRFDSDGRLWVSSGDDDNACAAQDPTDGLGVLMRLDISALPPGPGGPPSIATLTPPGNPLPGTPGFGPLTWAWGFRNPFSFDIDPVSGRLYVADVGESLREEVDEVHAAGLNFGWPLLQGTFNFAASSGACGPVSPYTPPMIDVPHTEGWQAIMMFGGRYRNRSGGTRNFGALYEGDVFYNDFATGEIRRLVHDGVSWIPAAPAPGQPDPVNWATGMYFICHARIGDDGAIYYLHHAVDGELRRLGRDPTAAAVTIVSGDGQLALAGTPVPQPLAVKVLDAGGGPAAGMPVSFDVALGDAVVHPTQTVTDGAGNASANLSLGTAGLVDVRVVASSPGAAPATFITPWRGLVLHHDAGANMLVGVIRSATPFAPVLLTWDVPVGTPHLTTPWGPVWTSLAAPLPTLGLLDGQVTNDLGYWSAVFPNLPPTGGATVLFQAFAVDALPAPRSILVSNPAVITFN